MPEQVFDVPEPRLTVTEYHRLRCQCPGCGHVSDGVFPVPVTAPTQYGDGVATLATMVSTEYALPFKKIQQLFADLDGYALNERTIVHAQETGYAALAPSETVLKAQVLASPVGHFDETGIRVAGRLHWQHVAATADATSLFIHPHRGTRALHSEDSLLPTYTGWAVHDCWASYLAFPGCRHALCGAHLLRELTALTEQGSRWAPQMQLLLLTLYRCTAQGNGVVTYPDRWSALYDALCQRAQGEEPAPERRSPKDKPTHTKGRNLVERLRTYKSAMLALEFHPEVPFPNNQAERDLRPVKVKQKIAGYFQTLLGAQHYARIHSFLSTARKRQRHVFKELRQLFLGHSFLLAPAGAK